MKKLKTYLKTLKYYREELGTINTLRFFLRRVIFRFYKFYIKILSINQKFPKKLNYKYIRDRFQIINVPVNKIKYKISFQLFYLLLVFLCFLNYIVKIKKL